jgi:hypothetical protein
MPLNVTLLKAFQNIIHKQNLNSAMVKKSLHKFRQDYNVWVGRIFLNQSLSKQNDHCPYLDLIKVIGS